MIFTFEELREGDLLIGNRRDEEQVELSDVVNGDSRGAVCRRTNRGEIERKPECAIKFLPARDQFHREVTVLELLIARAVEVTLFELRLLPLSDQLGKILELSIDQRAARQVSGETVWVLVGTS